MTWALRTKDRVHCSGFWSNLDSLCDYGDRYSPSNTSRGVKEISFRTSSEHDLIKALKSILRRANSTTGSEELYRCVADEFAGIEGVLGFLVHSANHEEKILQSVVGKVSKHESCDHVDLSDIPFGAPGVGQVAETEQPSVFNDTLSNTSGGEVTSHICVPFFCLGKFAGVIQCIKSKHSFSDDDHLDFLTSTASVMGLKLDIFENENTIDRVQSFTTEREERFQYALRGANDGIWDWNLTTDHVFYSPRWFGMLGRDAVDFPETLDAWSVLVNPEDKERVLNLVNKVVLGVHDTFEAEFSMLHKDGRWIEILSRAFPLEINGRIVRLIGTHVDITERKNIERQLRLSEERYKLAVQSAAIWDYDLVEDEISVSSRFGSQLGYSEEQFAKVLSAPLSQIMHPDDVAGFEARFMAHLSAPNSVFSHELRYRASNGEYIWFSVRGQCIYDSENKPVRSVGLLTEISEQKFLEQNLAHAQKMEAIGELTGGVAHDFNNMLAVIQGNAELLEELNGEGSEFVGSILRASRRGAELTQRLLAFSRQQPLNPEPINLGALVSEVSGLLQRTLGATIEIETITSPDLGLAMVDLGQVENALLNLAINARDAMKRGGKLTIKCSNSDSGNLVVLSVTDQGEGMTDEVKRRAFDPFFTTKEIGKGSGLGLSMVYGFAKQSGGYVEISSKVNHGTMVEVYLPRAASEVFRKEEASRVSSPRGQNETILIVEDDVAVCTLVEQMLKNLGYKVLCAKDARAAKKVISAHPETALIICDVVLPGGMSGPELIREINTSRSNLKVVFMSGYLANAIFESDVLLLNKPFKVGQLATVLSDALK
jgi:PAS domain S-box-containing protein